MSNIANITSKGILKTHLLGIPAMTHTCQYAVGLKTFSGSSLKAGDVHCVQVIYRSRGDGTPTSSLCSSVTVAFYESAWKWSVGPIYTSSAAAYSNIGKVVNKTGSWTITSTHVASTTIAVTLYFLVQTYYGAGSDSQTHDLYYLKYWNNTTGEVYYEIGNPIQDKCPLGVDDFAEV